MHLLVLAMYCNKYIKMSLYIQRQATHMYWKYIKMYDLCEEHTVDICNILPGIHAFPGVTPLVVLMGKASKLFES